MPLNALRSFEAAARLGSFREAAEELSVTPSAVSLQVRRLEEIFGRPLFARGHRAVTLTPTGASLAPRLSKLFSEMEQLLSASLGGETSLLRISAMPSFANQWLAPRLGRFLELHPEYQVRVAGEDGLVSFDRNEADIGLRYGRGDYRDLHTELLSKVEAFPVCSPAFASRHAGNLRHPRDLADLPLLQDEVALKQPGLPTWHEWFKAAGVAELVAPSGPRFESLHMALMGAVNGQGVALGLTPLVETELSSGRLVRLFDVAIPSSFSFWLVCSADRAKSRKIAAFRSWIMSELNA